MTRRKPPIHTMAPFLPFSAERTVGMLGLPEEGALAWRSATQELSEGHSLGDPVMLFRKLEPDDVEPIEWPRLVEGASGRMMSGPLLRRVPDLLTKFLQELHLVFQPTTTVPFGAQPAPGRLFVEPELLRIEGGLALRRRKRAG